MMRGAFAFAWAEEDEKSKNEAPKFNIMKVTIMLRTPSTNKSNFTDHRNIQFPKMTGNDRVSGDSRRRLLPSRKT